MGDYSTELEKQNEQLQEKLAKFEEFFSKFHKEVYIIESISCVADASNEDMNTKEKNQLGVFYRTVVVGLKDLVGMVKHIKASHTKPYPSYQLGFRISKPSVVVRDNRMISSSDIFSYNFNNDFEHIDEWSYNKTTQAWEEYDTGHAQIYNADFLKAIGAWEDGVV